MCRADYDANDLDIEWCCAMVANPNGEILKAQVVENSATYLVGDVEIVVDGVSLYFGAEGFKSARALVASLASIAATSLVFQF